MMLKVAPVADAVRALFVGRRRMGATILRWLTIIVQLIQKILVIPAQAGISVPLPRPLKTREIPAFAGMTTKDRQAGKRDGLGSAARRSTVLHPYFTVAIAAEPIPPEPCLCRICAELSEPFTPASRTRDRYRVSGR